MPLISGRNIFEIRPTDVPFLLRSHAVTQNRQKAGNVIHQFFIITYLLTHCILRFIDQYLSDFIVNNVIQYLNASIEVWGNFGTGAKLDSAGQIWTVGIISKI